MSATRRTPRKAGDCSRAADVARNSQNSKDRNPRIDAILLAAGESRRMGFQTSPQLGVGAKTFIARTLRLILPAVERIVIVLGAHAERIRATIPGDARITIVKIPTTSTAALVSSRSVSAARARSSAAMVHLADHPGRPEQPSWPSPDLSPHARTDRDCAPRRSRGHPAIFDRSIFPELLAAPLSEGARVVVNATLSRIVYTDVDDPGVALDLDIPRTSRLESASTKIDPACRALAADARTDDAARGMSNLNAL